MNKKNYKRGTTNMTILHLTALSTCLLLFAGNVYAQSPTSPFKPMSPIGSSQNKKPKNYLGASLGSVKTDGYCQALQNCEEGKKKSWKAFAGVRLNDNIVIESGYVSFGEQSGTHASTGEHKQSVTAFTTTAVAGIPATEQIEIFGKAGVARWTAEDSRNNEKSEHKGTDITVGIGAHYDLGENLGVRAEWERFKDIGKAGEESDLDLLSIGVTFSSL